MRSTPPSTSTNYYPFGSAIESRAFASGEYRFGMNGQEKDDELAGTYSAEFWQYDSRLGRRWNRDPMIHDFPWQSSFSSFNNNPLVNIDYNGLRADKYTRKYNRWKRKNREELTGLEQHEIYGLFRNQKTFFGKSYVETRWAKRHDNKIKKSNRTGYYIKTSVPDENDEVASARETGQLIVVTDLKVSKGVMVVSYNMATEPDRLQIINSKTGEILFDTKDVKGADRKGRVKYKKGSGQSFEFDLEGDNQITIIVNGNEVNSGSYFEFKVEVKSSDKLLENIDVTSPRQRDVKETINENKENNDKDSD